MEGGDAFRGGVGGDGYSLGGAPFIEQSAFDFGEKADIASGFEGFPGDFGERGDDVKPVLANHFRFGCV